MSQKYPGGIVTANFSAPTSASAPGVWTLDQANYYIRNGRWPGSNYWASILSGGGSGWNNNSVGSIHVNGSSVYMNAYNYNTSTYSGYVYNSSGTVTASFTNAGLNAKIFDSQLQTGTSYGFPAATGQKSNQSAAFAKFYVTSNGTSATEYAPSTASDGAYYCGATIIDSSSVFGSFQGNSTGTWYIYKATGTTINWQFTINAAFYGTGLTLGSTIHMPMQFGADGGLIGFASSNGAISYQKKIAFDGIYKSQQCRIERVFTDGTNLWYAGWVYDVPNTRKWIIVKTDTSGNVTWIRRLSNLPGTAYEGDSAGRFSAFDPASKITYCASWDYSVSTTYAVISAIDENGNFLNSIRVTVPSSTSNSDRPTGLLVTPDAIYFVWLLFYATTKNNFVFKLPKSLRLSGSFPTFSFGQAFPASFEVLSASSTTVSVTTGSTSITLASATFTSSSSSFSPTKTNTGA